MSVELHFLSGTRLGERLRLEALEFQIGVGAGCDVAIDPQRDPQAAGCRLLLRRDAQGWQVRNLGRPGAWVNQQPLTGSLPLRSGDVVRLSEEGPDLRFTILADAPLTGQGTQDVAAPRPAMIAPPPGSSALAPAPVPQSVATPDAAGLDRAAGSGAGTREAAQAEARRLAAAKASPPAPSAQGIKYFWASLLIALIPMAIWMLLRTRADHDRVADHPRTQQNDGARDTAPHGGAVAGEDAKPGGPSGQAAQPAGTPAQNRKPQRRPKAAAPRSSSGGLRPRTDKSPVNSRPASPLSSVLVLALEPVEDRPADEGAAPRLERLVPFAAACAVRHKDHVMLLTSGWTAYLMQQFWLLLDDAGQPRVRFFGISTREPVRALEVQRIFVHEAYARAHETLPDVPAEAPANLGLLLVHQPHTTAVAAVPYAELLGMRRGSVIEVAAVLGVAATPEILAQAAAGGLADIEVRFQQVRLERPAATREEAAPVLHMSWPVGAGRPAEGTPLFDEHGRVVGVCTAQAGQRLTASGIAAESLAALWEPDLPVMWREFKALVRTDDLQETDGVPPDEGP